MPDTPTLPSLAPLELRIERDVKVPMRDGVRLSANIFRPTAPGRYPVILVRMPYGNPGQSLGLFYARHGYAFVLQDCRGRFDSEGEFYPFRDDPHDGYDTLDWLCAQPWCNGRVGMFGPSYMALVQWAVAPARHPALQAMVPNVMTCDFWRRGYWCDGAFSLALTALWVCLEVSSRTSDLGLIPAYDLPKLLRHLPLRDLDAFSGSPSRVWQDFLGHSQYDEFWRAFSSHEQAHEIAAPAFLMGGWYDYYAGELCRAWQRLRQEGRDGAARHSRLLLGPWQHLISTGTQLAEVDFGDSSKLNINELARRWFDALLKDQATGILEEPPVTLFVMGINQWRQEHEWPLARTRYTPLYLHGSGRAALDLADGRLDWQAPGAEPPDAFTYDPHDPAPTLGGNHSICWPEAYQVIQPGPMDQRPVEARPDVATYTTLPLAEDLEVTGPVRLRLHAATDGLDTDWVARLVDVFPDGRAINLTEGVIRARFRESIHLPPRLLEPGRVYAYDIELQPTSNVFQRGHRIRLDLTSSCFPLWDRNPNTGHPIGQDAQLRVAQQTLWHDQAHPSHLLLPVIPAG